MECRKRSLYNDDNEICNVQTKEYDRQVFMYSCIRTHHILHTNNWNNIPKQCICI